MIIEASGSPAGLAVFMKGKVMKVALFLVLTITTALAQPAAPALPHETLFYTHDGLKLEAYLYVPDGPGPFPLVVYNHGSVPAAQEKDEWPAPYIARLLVPAGYALLVPERRGYGKSEGRSFAEEIGQDRGPRFIARHRSEASDINAAVEFVLARPGSKLDPKRVVNMGYSFGGIVTTLASGASRRYAAVILQAPGALNWNRSGELRAALSESASQIRVPMWCAVAENDATTESARALCAAANAAGARTTLTVYPPFTAVTVRPGGSPRHALFSPAGVPLWQKDALAFLAEVTQSPPAQLVAPPDQFFDSNGVRIRYVEQGQGPAIVLMHGYSGTLDRHFIANGVFADLAKDHRAIAIDLRGHGKSDKPHDPKAYGEEFARDVVRLLDHLKIQRAHLAGYSLGAFIAGRFATMHPERLLSVVYIAGLPMRDTSFMDSFAAESIKELESDMPFRSLVLALQPPGAKPPPDEEMRKQMAPLVAANDVKAFAALWRGYRTLAVTDEQLAAVRVPSIVITGSDDLNAAGIPELNKRHPQIKTVVVEGAQHGGPQGVMRRPEFLAALRPFLAGAR
jgi:pimeloyl-ACP methyl ester carboxylesterase